MTPPKPTTTEVDGPTLLSDLRAQRRIEQSAHERITELLAFAKEYARDHDDLTFADAADAAGLTRDGAYKRLRS